MSLIKRILSSFSLIVILIVIPYSLYADENLISLTGLVNLNIGSRIQVLEDTKGEWSYNDVIKEPANALFRKTSSPLPSYGFSGSAYWVKFTLSDIDQKKRYLIEVNYPSIDRISLYVADSNNVLLHHEETGKLYKFSSKEIFHRNPIFRVNPHQNKLVNCYMRFDTKTSMNLFINLWEEGAFFKNGSDSHIVHGIYYGAALIMILYNLFLFFSVRDKSYLYYSIYHAIFFMFQLTYNGIAALYFWPEIPGLTDYAIPLFVLLSIFFLIKFSISFLDIEKNQKIAAYLLKIIQWISIFSISLIFILEYKYIIYFVIVLTLVLTFILLASAVSALKKRLPQAKYYLFAWTIFWAGTVIFALSLFNILPQNNFTTWGQQGGAIIEMILISLGLAGRINQMKREVENVNANLEEIVAERTKELDNALKDMKFKDDEIQKEFILAGDIQRGILPETPYYFDGIRVEAYYNSMLQVGGDFYDIFLMKGGYLGILMADASGHGMPAAFITALAKISFNEAVQRYLFPADIFRQVNADLVENIKTDDFITAFLLVISPTFEVFYGNASHQMALVLRKKTLEIECWDTEGLFLGALKETEYLYQEKRDTLEYGDRILLYTDGLIDLRNTAGENYGEERLIKMFAETASLPLDKAKEIIIEDWLMHTKNTLQKDDVSMLLIEIDPSYQKLIEYRDLGFSHLGKKEIDQAIEYLRKALDINSDDELSRLYIGECYLKRKDFAEAAEHLSYYVKKNEFDANVWLHLAEALYNTGDYPSALKSAQKGTTLRKDFIEAMRISARSLHRLGETDKAADLWNKIIELDPHDTEAVSNLAKP